MSALVETTDMMIILESQEGEQFHVEREAVMISELVKTMIAEDDENDVVIPLPNVKSLVLGKV
jgi:hypothetical protein